VIELLRDDFALVIPSMPGFGFSTPVVDRGWTMARVARAYDTLMRRLGYERYGVHGSDGGALVARELGLLDPPGFLGAHVLHLFSFPSGDPAEFEKLEPADYAGLEHLKWFQSVGGYNAINASRPQTVAVGLSDSPVGQLAWNELFNSFGNGTSLVRRDQILAQVTLEWFTNTSATAGRYHFEEARSAPSRGRARRARGWRSSPTTSGRSRRSPSATTRTSSTGTTSTAAATTRRWRCRTCSPPISERSSPDGSCPGGGFQHSFRTRA
jgi:pimeloyl-ACP methyl ester carboxylesterase